MSKEEEIEIEGQIVEVFPSGKFLIQPSTVGSTPIDGHLAGKLRQNKIRVVLGDYVTVCLSPYDLTKGRITFRHK